MNDIRLLIADQDSAVRSAIKKMATAQGYLFDEAADGIAASSCFAVMITILYCWIRICPSSTAGTYASDPKIVGRAHTDCERKMRRAG
jgi:hypothetical protein